MLFAVAASLAAQDSRFNAGARLVVVPVSVTDLKGRSLDGLEASDFVVLDNGKPRKVAVDTIDTGVAPIALMVAVQGSGISAAVLEKVRKIGAMIQPLIIGGNVDAMRVANALAERGVLVPAIRPPTVPANTARLRVSLSAAHTDEDVARLIDALHQVAQTP